LSLESKVGVFIVAGVSLIATAIFLLGNYTFGKRYSIYVTFHDVSNLNRNAAVKLSGVDVGQVKDIHLEGDHAVVVLSIKDGIAIYQDSVFTVGTTGIIGSKYLEIDQGHVVSGVVLAQSTLVGAESVDIQNSIAKALRSIQKMIDDLNGPGPNGSLVDNLRGSVDNMRRLTANLNDLLTTIKPSAEQAMAKTGKITDKLDMLLTKSNTMMASLSTSEGTVGALLHDPALKQNVTETVSSLKQAAYTANDMLSRINQFRVYWNWDERYEPAIAGGLMDAGVKIVPREGRYYYGGLEDFSNPTNIIRKGYNYERINTIDALLGFTGKWYDLGLGIVRSAGGARLTLTPFYKNSIGKHFSLFTQAYDFAQNRTVNGKVFNKPSYDAGILATVNKYWGIGARVEDIAQYPVFQGWLHVNFEDKDISYLFGLMTYGAAGTKGRSPNKDLGP
jgi:phospholipid/cholesterol/gamma-HCH transport system substrate-binding protein